MRQTHNSQTNNKDSASVRTHLWKVIFLIGKNFQWVDSVLPHFGYREVFDIASLVTIFETHKYFSIFGNIMVFVSSSFMPIGIYLDRPIVVEPIETQGEKLQELPCIILYEEDEH